MVREKLQKSQGIWLLSIIQVFFCLQRGQSFLKFWESPGTVYYVFISAAVYKSDVILDITIVVFAQGNGGRSGKLFLQNWWEPCGCPRLISWNTISADSICITRTKNIQNQNHIFAGRIFRWILSYYVIYKSLGL